MIATADHRLFSAAGNRLTRGRGEASPNPRNWNERKSACRNERIGGTK
jgi:hypothetical protein